jgi:hypothetical protein
MTMRAPNAQVLVLPMLLVIFAGFALASVSSLRCDLPVERDFAAGNPPFAKPVEARQVTGPSLRRAIELVGDDPSTAIDEPAHRKMGGCQY